MKVFLSYGHDANAPLVQRIRDDLKAARHAVWYDWDKIETGDPWRRSIIDGLKDTDWTLGFLSRHSVRDPGVCLDELSIAMGVRHGAVATVLVEAEGEVKAPVSVSHIQWLDMSDWTRHGAVGDPAWEGALGGRGRTSPIYDARSSLRGRCISPARQIRRLRRVFQWRPDDRCMKAMTNRRIRKSRRGREHVNAGLADQPS